MAKGKKQEDPNKVAQRKQSRVEFVQANPNLAPEVARQRFYVQSRAAELESAGKPVDRAALREKFQTGGVTREGFYTPGDINRFNASRDNGSSLADTKNTGTPPIVSNTPVAPVATPTPITGGGKTPSSSYQAPQLTTSLGQVAQPSTSYMGPQARTPNPVRGGEPGRGVTPPKLVRPGMPVAGGEPDRKIPRVAQNGMSIGPATTDPREGREFSATVGRVFPQAPANPKALRQQQQARFERVEVPKIKAEMIKNIPLRKGEQERIDAGYVPAPYDWTNLYKFGSGTVTLAAEILGSRGGPIGSALASGIAFNTTERLGNLLEQKGAFGGMPGDPGRYEGKTDFKSAAVVAGAALTGDVLGKGIQKVAPIIASKIPGIKTSVADWAESAVAREGMNPTQQLAQRSQKIIAKGTKGTTAIPLPKDMPYSGTNYRVVTGTSSMPSAESETAQALVQRMRRETLAIGPIDDPGAVRPLYGPPSPVKAPAVPKSTETIVRDSGLVIPSTPQRTPAYQKALEDLNIVPKTQEPVSLADSKAVTAKAMADDGVAELTPRQVAARKAAATRAKNKAAALKLQETNIEVKAPTVPAAKLEPVPNVTPAPAPMSVVQGEAPGRLTQMRNHPAFTSKLPEAPPSLSVVKDDGVREINISFNDEPMPSAPPAKRPPTKRASESDAAYAKRLDAWQVQNEGEVFKAPAGFEQTRGSVSYQERTISRIEGGLSRTNRSRTTAFIEDAGMSPEGYPVQMEGESFMAFNKRSAEFSKSKGIKLPETPDNSFLAEGTPPSLADVKNTSAASDIPPKPSGLKPNAAYNPETGKWQNRRLDKDTGEFVFAKPRTKFATEEERKAAELARNAAKNERRKAERLVASTELKTKAQTVAASGGPDAEYGPFMFGGEPIGRSKVTLQPAEIPTDVGAQANISLTTPKMSEAESIWLNKTPTAEEEAFFRELGNARKTSAGRRVVRGTREATPADIQEYVRRMKGIRGEEGLTPGPDNVAMSSGQTRLEKEIEQVLGTDAVTAIKNIAMRGNTPPLTQNVADRGLDSLAQIKAASTDPLINKLTVQPPLPSASGRLREQAAEFFNAKGQLKGMTGAGRVRTWQKLTQSDWFKRLSVEEPSFANFLIEQNKRLGTTFNTQLADQASKLPKPKLRSAGWPGDKAIGATEMKAAAKEFDMAVNDTGLGAYDLKGEELVTGVNAGDFRKGTTIGQRAEAASIEQQAIRNARLVQRIKAEDQAAFGDVNYFNRGFERGQQLDPMVDTNVTKDYGIVDEKGFTNINQTEFNVARRQLNQPFQNTSGSVNQAQADMIEAQRKEIVTLWQEKKITKQEMNDRLMQARTEMFNAPSTALPANPFTQEFGATLPNDYVRQLPESYGKVWDPDTFTDEAGNKINGRWIEKSEAVAKAQKGIDRQAANVIKVEAAWNKRHSAFDDGLPWMDAAKGRAIKERLAKSEKVVEPIFRDPTDPLKPLDNSRAREEIRRVAAANERAAKIKASGVQGQTAEQIRFELKNPVFGPPSPASREQWNSLSYMDSLDPYAKALEESRLAAKDAVGEYESDALDWIND